MRTDLPRSAPPQRSIRSPPQQTRRLAKRRTSSAEPPCAACPSRRSCPLRRRRLRAVWSEEASLSKPQPAAPQPSATIQRQKAHLQLPAQQLPARRCGRPLLSRQPVASSRGFRLLLRRRRAVLSRMRPRSSDRGRPREMVPSKPLRQPVACPKPLGHGSPRQSCRSRTRRRFIKRASRCSSQARVGCAPRASPSPSSPTTCRSARSYDAHPQSRASFL